MERENELYHFGIKGMKWGIRRYQNSDGSLTPAGRKRYADEAAKAYFKTERERIKAHADNKPLSKKEKNDLNDKLKSETAKLKKYTKDLTREEINAGRYRVANSKLIKNTVVSTLTGTVTGGALTLLGVNVAVAATTGGMTSISVEGALGSEYYKMQKDKHKRK